MTTISLIDAQSQLPELVLGLKPGDEVVITDKDREVARLLPPPPSDRRPILGGMRGTVLYMADDFDAPLEGFDESDE
jgi:antitoxin (DNA-binding transcriptional repressor) of toxin-antitoxin stability system